MNMFSYPHYFKKNLFSILLLFNLSILILYLHSFKYSFIYLTTLIEHPLWAKHRDGYWGYNVEPNQKWPPLTMEVTVLNEKDSIHIGTQINIKLQMKWALRGYLIGDSIVKDVRERFSEEVMTELLNEEAINKASNKSEKKEQVWKQWGLEEKLSRQRKSMGKG